MRYLTLRDPFSVHVGDMIYRDNNGVLEFFDGEEWTESSGPGGYDDLVRNQNTGWYAIIREFEA
jgi:hypothetical protein